MDKERANDLLRYGIQILRGEGIVSSGLGRIHIALLLKENLEEIGAKWQVRILNAWIHRAQRGDFTHPKGVILSQRRERGAS